MKVQHLFPCHIQMSKFEDKDFDNLWLEVKKYWIIDTDAPKAYMRKWAIRLGINFRHRLARDYIYNATPDTKKAYKVYKFIEIEDWEEFYKQRTSEEYQEIREKAKASNAKKKHKLHVGRNGWSGMRRKMKTVWPQLESSYPVLKGILNKRSKLFIMGHATKDKDTKLYSLDDVAIEKAGTLVNDYVI
ncbi:uncharacterized protein LOC143538345 [Bidens hawaiensis]|uniref:uncharacterized protein LOC143538345 n=1 Tax=Bidens hawaiensis TaxID=980011 RepID=UPI00404AAA59